MTTRSQTRRQFLRNLLLASGGATALSYVPSFGALPSADAAEPKDHYFVLADFEGGWDALLSLDTRDPFQFTQDRMDQTQIHLDWERLASEVGREIDRIHPAGSNIVFGPFIGELAAYYDRMAVVRGISMANLSHNQARKHVQTGKAPSGLTARGSSGAVWLAARLAQTEPLPNLSIGVTNYNTDHPPRASAVRVQGQTDLMRLLNRREPVLPDGQQAAVNALLDDLAECPRAKRLRLQNDMELAREQAYELLDGEVGRLFDFGSNDPEIAALRDHFGFGPDDTASANAKAAITAQALLNGISRVVSFKAADQLDSHFGFKWERYNGPHQEAGFTALARLAAYLDQTEFKGTGDSWLDHTTIVAFSEFQRTPLINGRGGRDHWPTNCVMLLGGGIRGNFVVGASSDVGMRPLRVDLETGAVAADSGTLLEPNYLWRTLMVHAGLENDEADLRCEPIRAILNG